MSYFEYLPTELVLIISRNGKYLKRISEAWPDIGEKIIPLFVRQEDGEIYNDFDNITKDLNITWYEATLFLLDDLDYVGGTKRKGLTLKGYIKFAISDFNDNSGTHTVGEEINGTDVFYAKYISLSIYAIYAHKHDLYNYIIHERKLSNRKQFIFSWLYINMIERKYKNIVLSPDLDCDVMRNIIRLLDENF